MILFPLGTVKLAVLQFQHDRPRARVHVARLLGDDETMLGVADNQEGGEEVRRGSPSRAFIFGSQVP
jgi:hypothetical protein